ncbi:MAG: CUB domain-containing protein, partial [bacterium]
TGSYSYPVQCAGGLVLLNKAGSLEDGSGPVSDYLPTANCMWLIDPQTEPDSVTSITLTFGRFATNPGDFVTVYDGASTGSPVLGTYSGDTLPPAITSTGNKMLVTFVANGNPPSNGFYATYSSVRPGWCTGITIVKADTAEFSDGSFGFDYYNSTLCKWKVESASGGPLTIYFGAFDTEEGNDFLTIYDLGNGDTLASISGHYTPGNLPDSVTSPSGKMFIIFTSNSSVTANGWEIYYPRKPNTGIVEPSALQNVKVYPNPAWDQVTLEFVSSANSAVTVSLLTPDGRIVQTRDFFVTPGANLQSVDLSGLNPGIYFLLFRNSEGTSTRKLILH